MPAFDLTGKWELIWDACLRKNEEDIAARRSWYGNTAGGVPALLKYISLSIAISKSLLDCTSLVHFRRLAASCNHLEAQTNCSMLDPHVMCLGHIGTILNNTYILILKKIYAIGPIGERLRYISSLCILLYIRY